MPEHPLRIGTEYTRQFSRPEDALREKEEAERKAALSEVPSGGEHEALAAFNEAWEQVTGEIGATEVDAAPVDEAIMSFATQADQAVEQSKLTGEQRLAKAIAAELKGQVIDVQSDSGSIYVPTDDDEATDEETARLEAELELSGDDEEVGTDAAGNTIYRDSEGTEYILTDTA